jgi:hypothetical protein
MCVRGSPPQRLESSPDGWISSLAEIAARLGVSRREVGFPNAANPYSAQRVQGIGAEISAPARAQTPGHRGASLGS